MELLGRNISKTFGSNQILDRVDIHLKKGEIVGLLGLNGVGKTTLLKILAGINLPDSGAIERGSSKIAYLSERNPLYPFMYVKEYLEWIADLQGVSDKKRKVSEVVTALALEEVLQKKIAQISKGFRQRVGLAATTLSKPDVIILDEPISGLDPVQINQYRSFIKAIAQDKIIILSSHLLQEIEALCDRVYYLKDKKLFGSENSLENVKYKDIRLKVRLNQDVNDLLLKALKGVLHIQKDGPKTFTLTLEDSDQIEDDVFDWVVSQGLKLRELRRLDHSHTKFLEN